MADRRGTERHHQLGRDGYACLGRLVSASVWALRFRGMRSTMTPSVLRLRSRTSEIVYCRGHIQSNVTQVGAFYRECLFVSLFSSAENEFFDCPPTDFQRQSIDRDFVLVSRAGSLREVLPIVSHTKSRARSETHQAA